MTKAFYPKKAKAKMRERRRKMKKAVDNGDGGAGAIGNHEHEHEHGTTLSDGKADGQSSKQGSGRKRTADQMSNGKKQEMTTITIPAGLTSKEAKKFRKDARRKARTEGQPEDKIKFVMEGQEPEEQHTTKRRIDSDTHAEEDDDDDKHHKKKKAKAAPSFPRINDLLAQQATQQKLDDKLSKQKSLDDSLSLVEKQKYVAVDCEMVGIGPDGKKSALARASVVNWDGDVLLDTFVRVPERVTDFRTSVSGVRPKDIHPKNANAMDHEQCRLAVGNILVNKILVGHALKNDLAVLMLDHPRCDIRDTARYKPFMRPSGRGGGKLRPRKLRDLVLEELGRKIQVKGEAHCSVDDARASMELFKVVRGRWEKELLAGGKGKKGSGVGGRGKK